MYIDTTVPINKHLVTCKCHVCLSTYVLARYHKNTLSSHLSLIEIEIISKYIKIISKVTHDGVELYIYTVLIINKVKHVVAFTIKV